MIVKNAAFWMFADICRTMPRAFALAAHSESLVMCIFHLFSEATQWSLDFLEPVNSAVDENWSSPQTSFQCSSLLSDTFTKTWSRGLSCVFVVSRLPAIVVDGSKSFSFPCIRTVSSTTPGSASLLHGFTHGKSVPFLFSTPQQMTSAACCI